MRRSDREIKDLKTINEIISGCYCCRLGFADNGKPYIVPLNFGHIEENGKHTFYFHSAAEGRKLDLIRQNGYAGFELDRGYELHPGEIACTCSAAFQSVIGSGKIHIVETPEEKRAGLEAIMRQATGKSNWSFSDEHVAEVCVIRLDVEELSCKVHL